MMSSPGKTLEIRSHDPRDLVPAPWNPNKATPEDQAKLDESLRRFGIFKPIICRELEDGSLQILGGHWRRDSAIRLGYAEIPVINLGFVPDERAKEITLVDNGRYGHDDAGLLADLLRDLGNPAELAGFMPYDLAELDAITATASIDLDTLGLADDDEAPVERAPKAAKTHEVMRFKVAIEDAHRVRDRIKQIMADQGFTESDELTNAGDALVWAIANLGGGET